MAKTDIKIRRTRLSKVVVTEPVEEEEISTTGEQGESVSSVEHVVDADMTEDDGNKDVARTPEEDGDRPDSQMDTVLYKVKGSAAPTVTVSGKTNDETNEDKRTATDEVTVDNMMDKDSQMETVAYEVKSSTVTTVSVSWEKEEEGNEDDQEKRTDANDQMTADDIMDKVNGKRKADCTHATSPPKKMKLINDGYCLYVGNLNKSTQFEELKNSLATWFMTHSLLVQNIRLDRSKKYAHVDVASEMDLTKALTLNGEMVLGQPMKIRKAKVKTEEEEKVNDPLKKKNANNARSLFVKKIPHDATKQDILKLFPKATAIRFLGGAESPRKGIAFVEFQNKAIAERALKAGQKAEIQGKALIVESVRVGNTPKTDRASNDTKSKRKATATPNKILFVCNLSEHVTEKNLKNIYRSAVHINIPKRNRKSRGLAYVEFSTVEDAEKAMQSSQNIKIRKRKVKVQFSLTSRPQEETGVSKTLFVKGLTEKTTAQTLKSAFDGALSAKVVIDKDTGVSKKFGFVNFKTEEDCRSAKDASEDCEIDGAQVTVVYARPKLIRGAVEEPAEKPVEEPAEKPVEEPAGAQTAETGRKGRKRGQRRGAGPTQTAKEVENIV